MSTEVAFTDETLKVRAIKYVGDFNNNSEL